MHLVRSSHGFTLLEIMVVVFILGLLATLITVGLFDRWESARRTKAGSDLAAIKGALQLYKLDHGRYPTTGEGLTKLVEPPPGGEEGYLEKFRVDPWGNAYNYETDGGRFLLKSFARDGREGGDGHDEDITSDDV